MKNALVLLLVAGVAAAAPPEKKPAPTPTAAETLAGWSDLRWGMTTQEVDALHPEGRWRLLRLLFPTTILGEAFDVEAVFEGGRLARVEMEWAVPDETSESARQQFLKKLAEALSEKYGPPAAREEALARWSLPRTEIEARISRLTPKSPIRSTLVYSDASGGNPKGNL